jgi:hypothetical protein
MLGSGVIVRYRGRMRIAILLALGLAAAPTSAQDPPLQGIGFAQAEEGAWLCRHEDPFEALACAREHCAEEAPGQPCTPTAWCHPAGWSGIMTVWLPDFHVTRVLCGMSSETGLTETLKTLCVSETDARSCDLVLVIDPNGNERPVEGVSFPGGSPVAPGSEAAAQDAEAAQAEPPADAAMPVEEAPASGQ